jgi:multidrug efflux pump subunit AcrA (membrane-fusion protein)
VIRATRAVLAALAAASIAATGCGRHAADDDASEPAPVVPVRVARLESRSFREQVEASGQWRASSELAVSAPFAAYVESLRVEVGDAVERGGTLATLVTRESRAAVLGAEQLVAAAAEPAERAEAERALRQARRDVVRVPLRAGGAGIVVRRAASPGAEVAEGAELVAILAPQALIFEAHVPAREAARVAMGDSARIEMEGLPALAATVRRRLPQTSATDQSALVWLAPARTVAAALQERFGTAAIATGAPRRALAVPDSALVEDDLTGEVRIATVGGDVATWHAVRLGLAAGGWHELLAPELTAGTRVIVSGQRGLPDSTHVAIEP